MLAAAVAGLLLAALWAREGLVEAEMQTEPQLLVRLELLILVVAEVVAPEQPHWVIQGEQAALES